MCDEFEKERPAPLDYRAPPRPSPSNPTRPIVGFFLGLVIFGFPNACISLGAMLQGSTTIVHMLVAIYAAIVVAATLGFPLYAPPGRRDTILSGMFLGFGVAALLSGLSVVMMW